MKKNELLKILVKLKNEFENDLEALNHIDFLVEKASSLPETHNNNNNVVKNLDSLPLPEEMKELHSAFAIFADGACRGNPGPGAWATIIQNHKADILLKSSGVDVPTTNNKMELEGVIRGLKGIIEKWIEDGVSDRTSPVFVYSDSKYVVEGMEKWVSGWKLRGWKKADNKEPENLSMWKELDDLRNHFENISFIWVKGHAGHPQNELCDQMANFALDEAGF